MPGAGAFGVTISREDVVVARSALAGAVGSDGARWALSASRAAVNTVPTVAKYFKISIGELLSLSANGLQSQTKEAEIRVGGGGAMFGWDDVETDQVAAVAVMTTIADAAMILRMKCIVYPVGSAECDRQVGMSDVGEPMRGPTQAM
jgi:hypothetical protein